MALVAPTPPEGLNYKERRKDTCECFYLGDDGESLFCVETAGQLYLVASCEEEEKGREKKKGAVC
jgi:hypothetical protein